MPIKGAKSFRPFASCSMDMIIDLPLSNGYDSILVVVDHSLMKGVILIPCNKTLTADQCAKLLLDNVYKWFGLMDKSFLIEDLSLLQNLSLNYWNCSKSNQPQWLLWSNRTSQSGNWGLYFNILHEQWSNMLLTILKLSMGGYCYAFEYHKDKIKCEDQRSSSVSSSKDN